MSDTVQAPAQMAGRSRMTAPTPRNGSSRLRFGLLSLLVFVVFIAAWQLIVKIFDISPYILPTPSEIFVRLIDGFKPGPASLYDDIWTTFREMIYGYVIAAVIGLFVGLAMARIRGLEQIAYPYVFALQAVPMVALAPLLVIWFGFDQTSKIVIVTLCAFFPMMVSSLTAFKAVDPGQEELFTAMCSSKTRTFLKLRVPAALPFLLAGLDLSLVHSLVGAIVAEFVSGQAGLGVRLLTYNSQVDVTGSFAVIIVLCLIGVICHSLLVVVRRKSLSWQPNPGRGGSPARLPRRLSPSRRVASPDELELQMDIKA